MIPVVLLVSFMVFSLLLILPGDPAITMLGDLATPAQLAAARQELGLDRPIPVQYIIWLGNALQGNLGRSIQTHQRVTELIGQTFPVTLELAFVAMIIAVAGALPLAVFSATRRGSRRGVLVDGVSYLGVAMPDFWLGILLILLVALRLRWLPPSGYESPGRDIGLNLKLMILPAATLAASRLAVLTRQARSSLLEVLDRPYIVTSRSKGLSERRILMRHALKNAFIPIVTVLGLQVGYLLGGAVIVEVIFAMPGLGRLAVDAIFSKDFPVLQAVVLIVALAALGANLAVDVAYAYLNPRIRYS